MPLRRVAHLGVGGLRARREGPQVPELLRKATPPGERTKTLTNLFKAGQPTRAMVEGAIEYERYLDELMTSLEAS